MHYPSFIKRQIGRSPKRLWLFVLSVVFSMAAIVGLNGFTDSLQRALLKDAKKLIAGDIIVSSRHPFSPNLESRIHALEGEGTVSAARLHEFYTLVRPAQVPGTPPAGAAEGGGSLLVRLKAVGEGYPFYGRVALASGRPLSAVLTAGRIVVARTVLQRLGVKTGDTLVVGDAPLVIADVLLREPDHGGVFSFGPRILAGAADLPAMGLLGKRSRVRHKWLLKVHGGEEKTLARVVKTLSAVAIGDREKVNTAATAETGVKRFFDDFLFYLSLIGIFILMLSAVGIGSSLSAYLREEEMTVATLKTLGATGRFVTASYVATLGFYGFVATLFGIAAGGILQQLMPRLFSGILPKEVAMTFPLSAAVGGLVLGGVLVSLFSLMPLIRLRRVRPADIFTRSARNFVWDPAFLAVSFLIFALFAAMVTWQLNDVKAGLLFSTVLSLFFFMIHLLVRAALAALKRISTKNLAVRQALKGLFRPSNATAAILTALAASLSLIFTLHLVEKNLDGTFVNSFPADSPNLYFIDIQASQVNEFTRAFGEGARLYPVIRGRVASVNGRKIDRKRQAGRRGDNLARPMNLTYRNHLLADEAIERGGGLFSDSAPGIQVSVLDSVLAMTPMALGDRLTFDIQGVPLTATIVSIRTRAKKSLNPFFYFVFREEALAGAPRTFFSALRAEEGKVAALQTKAVTLFPNVSVIDVSGSIRLFAGFMEKLSRSIRFFTLIGLAAGLLIIASSVMATKRARIREAVYYKILGARSRFVLLVFTLENLVTGFSAALIALCVAQVVTRLLCRFYFEIPAGFFPLSTGGLVCGAVFLVVAVGGLATIPILREKPAAFLRRGSDE